MSNENASPATPQELRASCAGASDKFILGQMEKGATVAQSVQAYNSELSAENQRLKAQAETKNRRSEKRGVEPLHDVDSEAGGGFAGGNASEEFNSRVDALIEKGKTRSEAVRLTARRNPEMREAMVAEANA